jgi:hypothetical protein
MAEWFLAPSLVALRTELNRRWPNRDKSSDGSVGDTSHQARKSDHNPDWDAGGIVRAIDIDKDGIDVDLVLDSLIGDQRVWYVIHNRKIWSRTTAWKPKPYDGPNPHDKHIHVSIMHTPAAANDRSTWLVQETPQPPQEAPEMTPEQLQTVLTAVLDSQRKADDRYEAQAEAWRIAAEGYGRHLFEQGKSPTEVKDAVFAFLKPLSS